MDLVKLHEIFIQECGQKVSTDTRKIEAGCLFFAWKGEKDDGNRFAQQALDGGASYVVVDNPEYVLSEKCILVENSIKALQDLASYHRKQFDIPVLVIGGSNGKTTTKELVVAVLNKKYCTHYTQGNLNNHTGVPLTLLAMNNDAEVAVIEVGANHGGEHALLMDIIAPDYVLVTNNGKDHLEGFGSLEGVRRANKEIYDWAKLHDATMLVNKNISDLVIDSEGGRQVLYPIDHYESTSTVYASVSYKGVAISSNLFGSYNEANILAAIVVGERFGVTLSEIQDAIAAYVPNLNRSQVITREDCVIILDCYNANPSSMELAIADVFASFPSQRKIIVIGDMLELGEEESVYHQEILSLIAQKRTDQDTVICVGPLFNAHAKKYPYHFFETVENAKDFFADVNKKDAVIFIKASRGIRLETILDNSLR